MKRRKVILLPLVIFAGFLPSLALYTNIKIEFLPILYFIGFALFLVVIIYTRKSTRQDATIQKKEINLYASVYAGSAVLFYIIGLIVFRK